MKRKLLCYVLIVSCIINTTFVNAESSDICVMNGQEVPLSLESTYVDGIEYDIDIDFDTGNIIVSGETEVSEGVLILESDGKATIDIENDMSEDELYTLDIEELSVDDVDLEIYDREGDLVADYDSYEDIVEDSYEGQEAVTVGLMVGAAALLYITTYYVIVKSGVTYCLAENFTKAIAKAKTAVKKKARKYYYPAVITTVNKKTVVYISPSGININAAAVAVIADKSIYSYTASMAKAVINKAGYAAVDSNGNKNAYDFHSKVKGYQFKHYHRGKSGSGGYLKKNGSCHSLFGNPTYVK